VLPRLQSTNQDASDVMPCIRRSELCGPAHNWLRDALLQDERRIRKALRTEPIFGWANYDA